jgi:DNA-binding LacI/PurR family transcriptional regulator
MNETRRITSHDVANLAGVSQATVSRAFMPEGRISAKTKQRVIDAADKLGYQPNVIARSLARSKSNLIGVLMANWNNPRLTETLQGFSSAFKQCGYKVILQSIGDGDTVDDALRDFLQYQVDGIIVISAVPGPVISAACLQHKVPIVVVNRFARGLNACSVTLDGAQAGRAIASDLLERGYKRFALFRGSPDIQVITDMFYAFSNTVSDRGLGGQINEITNISGYSDGRKTIVELAQQGQAPDAVLCSSDFTAFGVQAGARYDLDIEVPEKLGIVGIGDSPFSWWPEHDLTTLRFPVDEMVKCSADALLARIKEPELEPQAIGLESRLVVRGTTRKAE